MSDPEKIEKLANIIKQSKRVYVLTGAGISTESGIPDFRSPGKGLWEKINPSEVLSLTAFYKKPAFFYEHFLDLWRSCSDAKPNKAHYALAQMEKSGYIKGVITQNIDNLHRLAGSKNVWEIHGHMRTGSCLKCNESYDFAQVMSSVEQGINPPICDSCDGVIRPSVVLFEDIMSQDFFDARTELINSDLLIAIGSSLRVQPAASLPSQAKHVAVINKQPTPWDRKSVVVINDSIGDTLEALMKHLQ